MNCGCYNSRCFVKDSDIMMVKVLHDIKQPISAIGLIAEDIKETKSDDINIKINKMLDVCSNLNFMINGMLNFAKNNEIVGEKFNIKDVIMKICDEYSDKIEKRGIKLILKLNSYEVCQNLLLVERIIRNLVDNALKYAKTKFLIKNIGGSFWIVDDGAGIDKIYQKQVFEDFSQCNGLTTANDGSGGLGLGIVKCLASLIGANIKLKSQKNCYTIFRVCL